MRLSTRKRAVLASAGACAAVLVLAAAGSATDGFSEGSATQIAVAAGGSKTASEQVNLDAGTPSADIVYAFDTSESTIDAFPGAKFDANEVTAILSDQYSNLRFAVAHFEDYPLSQFDGEETDTSYALDKSFTDDHSVPDVLAPLENGFGGDDPGSYFGVFKHVAGLDWAPGATRILVVFGDQTGHDDKQQSTFESCPNSPIRDGGSIDPFGGSATDALGALQDANVTLYFVTSHGTKSFDSVSSCHRQLADATDGGQVEAGNASLLAENLSSLIASSGGGSIGSFAVDVTTSPGQGSANPASWVTLQGVPTGSLDAPATIKFGVKVSPPADTTPGFYGIDLAARADGVVRARQHISIEVRAPATEVLLTVDQESVPAGLKSIPLSAIPPDRLALNAGTSSTDTLPLGSAPIASTPIASTPIASTPIASTPIASTPIASTGLLPAPIASTPIASTALSHVLLSQVHLIGTTWDNVLCPPLLGKPLNAMTLADVAGDACSAAKFRALTLGQVDLSSTLFKRMHWTSLLLGQLPLASVPLPSGFATWNDVFPNLGGALDPLKDTLLSADIGGGVAEGSVGSTPIASTPIASTPIASTPIASTHVKDSKLALVRLADISPPGAIVDCTKVDCVNGTLGDAYPAAILPSATLGNPALTPAFDAAGITLNDIVTAMLAASDFPWEHLPLDGLQAVAGTHQNATYHLHASIDCSVVASFRAAVQLPEGFFPVAGTSTIAFGDASPAETDDPVRVTFGRGKQPDTYAWTLECPSDTETTSFVLTFQAYAGLTIGPDQTSRAAVTSDTFTLSASNQAPIAVTQNWEQNDDPATAPVVQADTLIVGHIAATGDQDFFRLPVDGMPRGTKIEVRVSHIAQGADFDATVTKQPAPGFFSAPIASTPIASTPIEDSTPLGSDNSDTTVPSEDLQDVPVGSAPIASTPIASTSTNRGNADEIAQYVTQGEGGFATIGISGYNGSSSNTNYVLRIKVTPPPTLPTNCPAPPFPGGTPAPGTLPGSLPTATRSLFIINRQRLTALYGAGPVNNLITALNSFVNRTEVRGAVLPVDGNAAVRAAYANWDANRCSVDAANAVVRSINDVVAGYRNSGGGLPNLHYIVLLGNDNAVPMARTPDQVQLSPEVDEANDLAFTTNGLTQGNPLYASAATDNILTDGAYGAFLGIPWLGHNLLLPQVSIARLVETPDDMREQIERYVGANGISAPQTAAGTLNPTTAVVTGYDFLGDGAASVRDNVRTNFPALTAPNTFASGHATIAPPDDPAPWTSADAKAGFLQAPTAAGIASLNGHYNHYELEAADGSLASTADASSALPGRVLFIMGCHGGLNIPNVGGSGGQFLDWPELFGQKQVAMYIGNSGYGYGDSASIALSERLLALYAKNLRSNSDSVGEQWVSTLQQYFATAGAYAVYDEKVMVEATFYGLPFWHFAGAPAGSTFTPLQTAPDPVVGTQAATVTVQPNPVPVPASMVGPTYWSEGDQTAFGLYRPIQPIKTQQVTANLPARGLWITALTTEDHAGVTPRLGMPTIDLAAHEPVPNVKPIFFPASPFSLQHSNTFGVNRGFVNVTGQFRPDPGNPGTGTERLVRSTTMQVFYSNSTDRSPPLISRVTVSTSGGIATVAGRVTDNGGLVAEVAALVNDGSWHFLRLLPNPADPTLFTGTIPVSTEPEVFLEATDGVNVAYSANKGSNFTSLTSAPDTGPQILIQAPVGPYGLNQAVNATYQCIGADTCVGTTPSGQPIDTSTVGVHTFVVTATDSSGNTTTLQRNYLVTDLILKVVITPSTATTGTLVWAYASLTNAASVPRDVTLVATFAYNTVHSFTTPPITVRIPAGKTYAGALPFRVPSFMPRGTYSVVVRASDVTGTVVAVATLTVT